MKNLFKALTDVFVDKPEETPKVEYHKTTMKLTLDIPPATDVSLIILNDQDLKKALAR